METGDLEMGFLCLGTWNAFQFMAGRSLDALADEGEHILGLIDQYKIESVRHLLSFVVRAMQDLSGKSPDPLCWIGEEMKRPSFELKNTNAGALFWRYVTRLQVAYYLGEIDLGYRLVQHLEVVLQHDVAYMAVVYALFFRALASLAMYRKYPKRMYSVKARKLLRQMRARVEKGKDVEILHKYYILEADVNATLGLARGKEKAMFDKAISTATRAGFVQDGALANELAGAHFLRKADKFWAKHYLTSAYSMYETWEARAKTNQMLEVYGDLIDTESVQKNLRSSIRRSYKVETVKALSIHRILDPDRSQSHSNDQVGSSSLTGLQSSSFVQSSTFRADD